MGSPNLLASSPLRIRTKIDWPRAIPYITMHVACLGVFWVGWSWTAIAVAVALYAIRVFVLTGFYHRYFSHRAFKTSRVGQFVFGVLGCTALQHGPLWWAAHHRHHHTHSDESEDLHSPRQDGFLWSHFGWFLAPNARKTNLKLVTDFAKFRELRLLDQFCLVPAAIVAAILFAVGAFLAEYPPELHTSGLQLLVWGFFISTVCVYHVTYLVNSVTHVLGRRRYRTKDDSRNNLWVALLTFGEGWHNNHHHYASSARQGFFWWEIDITYYTLVVMSWLGLVWDLRPVPLEIRARDRDSNSAPMSSVAS